MSKSSRALGKGGRDQSSTQVPSGGMIKGVVDEIKKVVWPTGSELVRMTGVVIATVVLATILIGGADAILINLIKPIYDHAVATSSNTTTNTTTNTGVTTTPISTATTVVTPGVTAPTTAVPTATP